LAAAYRLAAAPLLHLRSVGLAAAAPLLYLRFRARLLASFRRVHLRFRPRPPASFRLAAAVALLHLHIRRGCCCLGIHRQLSPRTE
jgi:hypothetical protein